MKPHHIVIWGENVDTLYGGVSSKTWQGRNIKRLLVCCLILLIYVFPLRKGN